MQREATAWNRDNLLTKHKSHLLAGVPCHPHCSSWRTTSWNISKRQGTNYFFNCLWWTGSPLHKNNIILDSLHVLNQEFTNSFLKDPHGSYTSFIIVWWSQNKPFFRPSSFLLNSVNVLSPYQRDTLLEI